jgi:hypothetical protein
MGQDLSGCAFETWLAFTFDRQVSAPPWYALDPYAPYKSDSETVLKHCTMLFREPRTALQAYTKSQIDQGFEYLSNWAGYFPRLADRSVQLAIRQAAVSSMFDLFEQFFRSDPPGGACFMWFERVVSNGAYRRWHVIDDTPLVDTLLSVQRRVLALPSNECKRSALHGLNHLAGSYPVAVAAVVDEFLLNNPNLQEDLRSYADACREGAMP